MVRMLASLDHPANYFSNFGKEPFSKDEASKPERGQRTVHKVLKNNSRARKE
jgi:hypothetical protein